MNFKSIALSFTLLVLNSCSLFQPGPQDKMSQKLKNYQYEISFKQLKPKLRQALIDSKSLSKAPGISLISSDPNFMNNSKKSDRVNEILSEEGFYYKGKVFKPKSFEISLMDLFNQTSTKQYKDRLSKVIESGDLHLVEENNNQLIFTQGNSIIKVLKVGKNKSQIKTCKLIGIERGNPRLSLGLNSSMLNGFNILSFLKIERGITLLEDTMSKHCIPDPTTELALFYLLKPEEAKSWESKFSAPKS